MRYMSKVNVTPELKEDVLSYITEIGHVLGTGQADDLITIEFSFGPFDGEPDDLWTMHERASEVETFFACRDIDWTPTRDEVLGYTQAVSTTATEQFIRSTSHREFVRTGSEIPCIDCDPDVERVEVPA